MVLFLVAGVAKTSTRIATATNKTFFVTPSLLQAGEIGVSSYKSENSGTSTIDKFNENYHSQP